MRRLALGLALVALTGCPHPPSVLERPWLRAAVRATGPRALAARLVVHNPNPEPMTARALDWELWLDGAIVLRERTALAVPLAAGADTAVIVPLPLPAATSARIYRLIATLHCESAAGDAAAVVDTAARLSAP